MTGSITGFVNETTSCEKWVLSVTGVWRWAAAVQRQAVAFDWSAEGPVNGLDWRYANVGVAIAPWYAYSAPAQQQHTLVGNVVRIVGHGAAPAGEAASFYAVENSTILNWAAMGWLWFGLALMAAEAAIRVVVFLVQLVLDVRPKSFIEGQLLGLYRSFEAMNRVGAVVLEAPVGSGWAQAARALEENVALLGRDCSGMTRYPLLVVPGRPAHVRVTVDDLGEQDSLERVEACAKALVRRAVNAHWDERDSPFLVHLAGGATRSAVVFAANHTMLDGTALVELSRRFLMLLCGQPPGPRIRALFPTSIEHMYPKLFFWMMPVLVRVTLAIAGIVRALHIRAVPIARQGGLTWSCRSTRKSLELFRWRHLEQSVPKARCGFCIARGRLAPQWGAR